MTQIKGKIEAVSASILKSLQKLNSAVEHLESSVQAQAGRMAVANRREQKQATPQNDLFSQSASSSTINAANVRMIATRLDTAINQVEQILKEGRA